MALPGARAALDADRKVLRVALRAAETGFDPQRIFDRYSVGICENLFETLVSYDYLARPVKLVPLADRKSTRLNSSHKSQSRMPSSA